MKNCTQTPQRLFGSSANSQTTRSEEVSFSPEEYTEVWQTLSKAIGERDYFSGSVTCHHQGFSSHLTTTLIIYRDRTHPEHPISDVVPIWWEMTTTNSEGEERLNDFSLAVLREKLKIEN